MYNPDEPRDDKGKWTSFEGSIAIRKAASNHLTEEEKIDAEENDYKEPIATRNIFEKSFYDNKDYKQEAGYYYHNKDKAVTEYVDIKDIHPTQLTIDGSYKTKSNELPILIRNDKGIHVLDGHHRIGQEVMSGATKIKAKVLYFNSKE